MNGDEVFRVWWQKKEERKRGERGHTAEEYERFVLSEVLTNPS